jgi:CubicO group peptidase (beta-lactamase class C family)
MFRRILLPLIAAILLVTAAPTWASVPSNPSSTSTETAQIDTYIQSAMLAAHIPGLALAVVNKQGIAYAQAYGTAGHGAMTTQTPIYIGSISKPFTALAVNQLSQAGKIDLQAPVQKYIPWFTLSSAEFSRKIRITDLLNQQSGISQMAGNNTYYIDPKTTREDLIRLLKDVRPNHPTGVYEYSNYNYIILGYVIEQVTGQSYATYIQEHILTPAGLERTYLDDKTAAAGGMADHYRLFFGMPVRWKEPYRPALQASGLIISSVEDMAHFAMLYLNNGWSGETAILPGHERGEKGYYDIYWGWKANDPLLYTAFHGGALDTANSFLLVKPGRNLGVVVLLNIRPDVPFPNVDAQQIAEAVAAIAQGNTPNPLNTKGFLQQMRTANLRTFGIMFALPLALTSAGRLLYRKTKTSKPWRIGFWVMALLEAATAAEILISVPLQTRHSWPFMLVASPDYMGANLVGAILYLAAAIVTGWNSIAKKA